VPESPALRVVAVLLTVSGGRLCTLLRRASGEAWALPSAAPAPDEPLRRCAERVVEEQIAARVDWLEQLYTFGNRIPQDPAEPRVIEVSYYGLVPEGLVDTSQAGRGIAWFDEAGQPPLAGDQTLIIRRARSRLRGKLSYTGVGFELLPAEFSLAQLHRLYEVILGKRIDKRNFRHRIKLLGIVEATGSEASGGRGRPAALYRFSAEAFQSLEAKGDVLAF
jgi:8-oxo-dGTP diphosphatase